MTDIDDSDAQGNGAGRRLIVVVGDVQPTGQPDTHGAFLSDQSAGFSVIPYPTGWRRARGISLTPSHYK
ncbi:hypothetical protein ACWCW7_36235 [Nocardia tengchongensis]